jgi:sortase (surface protein transpeptidase)
MGLLIAGLVTLISSGLFSGKTPAAGESSPPTTVNPRLIDRQPQVAMESPLLPDSGAARSSANSTLIIPAIGVRAAIVPQGIDKTQGDVGNLAVPWAANAVGWWDGGPAPGQGGVAVMAGHRVANWALWRLPDLRAGDAIELIGTNGRITNWIVRDLQEMPKADLPSSLWMEGGVPQLALVTCGGPFDYSTRHYRDNIVVWATPASM